jgi:hypothetical protein
MAKPPQSFADIKRSLSPAKLFGRMEMGAPRQSIPVKNEKIPRSVQAPQDITNKHAPGYDNDVPSGSWLKGGKPATSGNSNFDHSPKRGRERR